MCGITGWVDWEEDLTHHRATIERMAGTICHRGPDAQGCWLSPCATLAHYRLFVIDPQGGKQPMIYEDQQHTYVLTSVERSITSASCAVNWNILDIHFIHTPIQRFFCMPISNGARIAFATCMAYSPLACGMSRNSSY
jgi:hypothetical protein